MNEKKIQESRIYIHYGAKQYDLSKVKPIRNKPLFTKPDGGFWGCPLGSGFGWKEWCMRENFHLDQYSDDNSFQFTLSKNANIIHLNSVDDLNNLPQLNSHIPIPWILLDFEKLLSDGIDAIQLNMSNEHSSTNSEKLYDSLYFALYGWDCDSVLVMNKEKIEIL